MASIATTGLAPWPHRRVLLAVLVVSLVLNVCFVAGVAWTRMHPPPTGGLETVFQRMPAELELDDKQRAAFDRYVAEMRTRNEKVRQQVAPLLAGASEEMAKPGANTDEVTRQFAEIATKRQEAQRDSVVQTLEFLSMLSPDQRSKFVTLIRERLDLTATPLIPVGELPAWLSARAKRRNLHRIKAACRSVGAVTLSPAMAAARDGPPLHPVPDLERLPDSRVLGRDRAALSRYRLRAASPIPTAPPSACSGQPRATIRSC